MIIKKDIKKEKHPSPDPPAKKQCVRNQGASPVKLAPLVIVPMPPVTPVGGGAASPVEASGGGMYPEGAGSQEEERVVMKREVVDDNYNDVDNNVADDPESENENVEEKETEGAVSVNFNLAFFIWTFNGQHMQFFFLKFTSMWF